MSEGGWGGAARGVFERKVFFYASFIVHSGKQAELLYCVLPSPLPSLPILIHIWHSALHCSHTVGQMNTH